MWPVIFQNVFLFFRVKIRFNNTTRRDVKDECRFDRSHRQTVFKTTRYSVTRCRVNDNNYPSKPFSILQRNRYYVFYCSVLKKELGDLGPYGHRTFYDEWLFVRLNYLFTYCCGQIPHQNDDWRDCVNAHFITIFYRNS